MLSFHVHLCVFIPPLVHVTQLQCSLSYNQYWCPRDPPADVYSPRGLGWGQCGGGGYAGL